MNQSEHRVTNLGFLTLWHPAAFEDSCAKIAGSDHTWICTCVTWALKVVKSCS